MKLAENRKAYVGAGTSGVSVFAVILAILQVAAQNGLVIDTNQMMLIAAGVSAIAAVINGWLVWRVPNKAPEVEIQTDE